MSTPIIARVPGLAIFGAGVDGDVVQTGNTTLSRDMFYKSLIVKGTLKTNGYRIFSQLSCVIKNGGKITNNGGDAVSLAGGAGAAAGTIGGGQSGGGTSVSPGAFADAIGGGSTNLDATKGTPYDTFFWTSAGHVIGAGAVTMVKGGAGGSGGAGGGGGGGGGILWICTKKLTVEPTGLIQANGGAGCVPGGLGLPGAGGGGGAVVLRCIEIEVRGIELLKFKATKPKVSGIVAAGGQSFGGAAGGHGKVIVFAETGTFIQTGEN